MPMSLNGNGFEDTTSIRKMSMPITLPRARRGSNPARTVPYLPYMTNGWLISGPGGDSRPLR